MRKNPLITVVIILACISIILTACGRTPSRLSEKKHSQILKVENMENFISISFDKHKSSTVKDITFLSRDGYAYTKKFKDVSPLEGVIRWVPFGQDDSFIQSRAISRWTGKAVNLELPENCAKIICVDIDYESKDERVKNLIYLSTDGSIYAKEYREGIIDRCFEGWLEISAKE